MHFPRGLSGQRSIILALCAGATVVVAAACDSGGGDTPGGDGGASSSSSGGSSGTDGSVLPDGAPDAAVGCKKPDDCPSKVCNVQTGVCQAPACTDGTQNAVETDIDCGGTTCGKCDIDKKCKVAGDCQSGVCKNLKCAAPACDDVVLNGAESDVDCGGATCGKCDDAKKCKVRSDCKSDVCTAGKCATPSCDDGAKNGTDTDIDCGGPACPRCADNKDCLVAGDCTSGVCADKGMGLKCQPPACDDGVKNGDETDTDCGGTTCNGCSAGKACAVGSDCASLGCNYNNVCAAGRSCTGHYGGDTCGLGGAGGEPGVAAAWEDCCTTAPVTAAGKTVELDKYPVTAGRMRAFLESVSYDVRGFVQGARAAGKIPLIPGNATRTVLEPDWDLYLPTSFDGNTNAGELAGCAQRDFVSGACTAGTEAVGVYTAVSRHLGGFIFQQNSQTQTGCYVGSPGTHAFRFPNTKQDGAMPEADQNEYDTKGMQCIDYLVGQAFCVWDGGRLETLPEWQAAWGAGTLPWSATSPAVPKAQGGGTYWGCRFPWATDANHPGCALTWGTNQSIEYADFQYSYEYPKLNNVDYIVFISAPGRTKGRGPAGHSDIVGNNFELTSTVTYDPSPFAARHRWSGNGSWEVHNYSKSGGSNTMLLNKYGKLGLRCAHP
jgi:hypothetical protein